MVEPLRIPSPLAGGIAGLVLAGGRSRRMGRDKALIEVGGEALVVRQVRLLRELGASETWVSMGADGDPGTEERIGAGAQVIRDRVPDAGPAEGLEQVLERTSAEWVLALAVDLPALDVGFLRDLAGMAVEGVGVVPVTQAGREPLCALYPVRPARAEMQGWVQGTERSPRRLVAAGLAAGWMREWRLPEDRARQLINWNAPGDWTPPGG